MTPFLGEPESLLPIIPKDQSVDDSGETHLNWTANERKWTGINPTPTFWKKKVFFDGASGGEYEKKTLKVKRFSQTT